MRTAQHYRVVVDVADHRDDLVGILLDTRPGYAIGFIGDVVNNVVLVLVLVGDGRKEINSVVQVGIRIAGVELVPVDQCIHTALGSFFNQPVHLVGEGGRIGF